MITLIIGTNRPNSNSRKIGDFVENLYKSHNVPLRVLDLAALPPEIFLPDSYGVKPAAFQPFAEAIATATGFIVLTPEYNGGPPGVLKYFIDMLKFPESFFHRPVCFVGLSAGPSGGVRPVDQLQQIFAYRNAYLFPDRVFLPNINNLLDANGNLINPEMIEKLKNQTAGFIAFVNKLTNDAVVT